MTNLSFENIDKEFLVKIVSIVTRGKHKDPEMNKFLMIPKTRTSLNSFIKRPSMNQFHGPPEVSYENLTRPDVNVLLGSLTSKCVQTVMENHYFTVGGKIFRQSDGGPTGLDLTVEVAAIYMLLWDLAVLQKFKRMGIKIALYKHYVDDVVVFLKQINPGWVFDNVSGKLIYNPDHEYSNMEADLRTMSILRDIVNHQDTDIQMTIDVPSLHSNRRLPVLDLEVFLIENQINFSFYKKPMSNPRVNLFQSAISNRVKRDTLIQDGYRRMNNCSENISDAEKCEILSVYMNSLRISGYFAPYRYNILKGILNRIRQIEDEVKNGNRDRYRSRKQILDHKKQSIGNFPNTWFLKDDVTNILKVPCTPGSKLVNSIRGKCGQTRGPDGGRTKFVELGGLPLPCYFPTRKCLGQYRMSVSN